MSFKNRIHMLEEAIIKEEIFLPIKSLESLAAALEMEMTPAEEARCDDPIAYMNEGLELAKYIREGLNDPEVQKAGGIWSKR